MRTKLFPFLTAICTFVMVKLYLNGPCFVFISGLFCFLGMLLNTLAVAFNGWRMPVKVDKRNQFQVNFVEKSPIHFEINKSVRLKFLADIIDTPIGTFSIGDSLILIGFILTIVSVLTGLFF